MYNGSISKIRMNNSMVMIIMFIFIHKGCVTLFGMSSQLPEHNVSNMPIFDVVIANNMLIKVYTNL